MNELIELTQKYEREEEQKNKKIYKYYAIAAAIIIIGWVYVSFFNIHYKLEADWTKFGDEIEVEYGLSIAHSSVIYLKIPSEYEGEKIIFIDDYNSDPGNRLLYLEVEEGIERLGSISETYFGYFKDTFREGIFRETPLIYVKLPSTLKVIPSHTFYKCGNLLKVFFPETMEGGVIGNCAFAKTGIRTLELPDGMIGIGRGSFAECEHLRKVVLPNDLTHLPQKAFYMCNIKKLEGGENIRYVMHGAIKRDLLKYLENVIVADLSDPDICSMDFEADLEFVSEQSGIPMELLQHPYDSNEVIIEGKHYTLPIAMEKFLRIDAWNYQSEDIKEDGELTLEHKETGHNITVYYEGKNITGFSVYAGKNFCQMILPGGIVPGYTSVARFYALNRIYNDNDSFNENYIYGYGNSQGNFQVSIDELEVDGTIKEIDIEIKQTKE